MWKGKMGSSKEGRRGVKGKEGEKYVWKLRGGVVSVEGRRVREGREGRGYHVGRWLEGTA